ncbi:hypothetical protein BH24ACT21_BH24ACT21_18260 [soil metagenome]
MMFYFDYILTLFSEDNAVSVRVRVVEAQKEV